jgi:hypothetical protein
MIFIFALKTLLLLNIFHDTLKVVIQSKKEEIMQARRASRELAFILFSQFDKKITTYSKETLDDIILKSVRILSGNASR